VSAISRAGVSVARISNRSRRRPLRADLDLIERVDKTLDVLHGKWKVHLLFFMARGIHRHSRLLECTPGMSKKVMTDSLRALERDGLVQRRIFAEVPARVEYYITPLGWTVTEPLMVLADWAEAHAPEVTAARARFPFGEARAADRVPERGMASLPAAGK
jgi:DNA-binding HxlR family transcriptional regulator